jgi:hypothetical protein
MRSIYFTICILVLTGVAMAQAPATGPATRPTTRASRPRPTIELQYDTAKSSLAITLKNGGAEPIIVDQDLVIPLQISFYDDKGTPVRLTTQESSVAIELSDAAKRFITLDPGKSLTRTVDLRQPMRTWISFRSVSFVNDARVESPVGQERLRVLPRTVAIKRIAVVYVVNPADVEGLKAFTGKTTVELGLFTGPIVSETTLPDVPAKPQR